MDSRGFFWEFRRFYFLPKAELILTLILLGFTENSIVLNVEKCTGQREQTSEVPEQPHQNTVIPEVLVCMHLLGQVSYCFSLFQCWNTLCRGKSCCQFLVSYQTLKCLNILRHNWPRHLFERKWEIIMYLLCRAYN